MIAYFLALLANKLTAPIAVAGCVMLSLALGLSALQVHGLRHDLGQARQERDTANQNLGQCHGNVDSLTASLTRQNAAVKAAKDEGDRRTAEATKAAQQAENAADGYRKRAAALLSKPPVGADVCARVQDADRRVLEGLE